MLRIGTETLYTKSELLANVRAYLTEHAAREEVQKLFPNDIALILAVALNESEDFIIGAIRPDQRKEANA